MSQRGTPGGTEILMYRILSRKMSETLTLKNIFHDVFTTTTRFSLDTLWEFFWRENTGPNPKILYKKIHEK